MKALTSMAASLILVMLSATSAQAGTVKVEWHEPDEYTDIKSANANRNKFRKSVFKQFEKHFNKMAQKELPEGMRLEVKVTDLDLAGEVIGAAQYRTVTNSRWPSIEFEYSLYDGKRLVKSETVKLKDLSFMDKRSRLGNRSTYFYEKRLIKDWFVDDIRTMLAQWKKQQSAVMA